LLIDCFKSERFQIRPINRFWCVYISTGFISGWKINKLVAEGFENLAGLATFAPAPGDQLLQNLPRAETQQGYVVVAVCLALFFVYRQYALERGLEKIFPGKIFSSPLSKSPLQGRGDSFFLTFHQARPV